MPIRYMPKGDEDQFAAHSPIAFDEDTAWWAGAQQCAAAVALAAALAIAATTAQAQVVCDLQQDDPAGKLFGQPDEDYWQNPVAPVPVTFGRLYLPDPEEIPANTLRGQPDEDFWAVLVPPAVATWSTIVFRDDDVAVAQATALNADEDSWKIAVAPAPAINSPLLLPDPYELPAGFLFGQPDEDYWTSLTWPVAPPPRLIIDDDVLFPVAIPPIEDEDSWANSVAPVVAKNFVALPYLPDAEEVPAGFLSGVPQEDSWTSPIFAVAPAPRAFTDDEVLFPAAAAPVVDEDYRIDLPQQQSWKWVSAFSGDDSFVSPGIASDGESWFVATQWATSSTPKYFVDGEMFVNGAVLPGPFVAKASGGFAVVQSLAASKMTTVSGLAAAGHSTVSSLKVTKFEIIYTG